MLGSCNSSLLKTRFISPTLFKIDNAYLVRVRCDIYAFSALQWRHNGRDTVSNHQPHDCLLNRLFRRRSKKTLKLRVTGLCAGNSPGTGEFPAQLAGYAENVSIWWRYHGVQIHIYDSKHCHLCHLQHRVISDRAMVILDGTLYSH